VSLTGDHPDEMRMHAFLNDHDVSALLAGEQVSSRSQLYELAGFVGEVRDVVAGRGPHIGPQLEAVFDHGLAPEPARRFTTRPAGGPGRMLIRVAAMAGGLTLATAGAAAADLLPRAAQDGVAAVVERVTPLDLPDSHDRGTHEPQPTGPSEQPTRPPDGTGTDELPRKADTSGATTERVETVDAGPGEVGGTVPEDVSPPADDEGQGSARTHEGGSPSTTPSATAQDRAARDPRSAPPTTPPRAPSADDNPGSGHRR